MEHSGSSFRVCKICADYIIFTKKTCLFKADILHNEEIQVDLFGVARVPFWLKVPHENGLLWSFGDPAGRIRARGGRKSGVTTTHGIGPKAKQDRSRSEECGSWEGNQRRPPCETHVGCQGRQLRTTCRIWGATRGRERHGEEIARDEKVSLPQCWRRGIESPADTQWRGGEKLHLQQHLCPNRLASAFPNDGYGDDSCLCHLDGNWCWLEFRFADYGCPCNFSTSRPLLLHLLRHRAHSSLLRISGLPWSFAWSLVCLWCNSGASHHLWYLGHDLFGLGHPGGAAGSHLRAPHRDSTLLSDPTLDAHMPHGKAGEVFPGAADPHQSNLVWWNFLSKDFLFSSPY